MKQEQWIDIMVGSIVDQTERAKKTAKRMSGFFERQGDKEKVSALKKIFDQLVRVEDDAMRIYQEVEYQGPNSTKNKS